MTIYTFVIDNIYFRAPQDVLPCPTKYTFVKGNRKWRRRCRL